MINFLMCSLPLYLIYHTSHTVTCFHEDMNNFATIILKNKCCHKFLHSLEVESRGGSHGCWATFAEEPSPP